MSVKLTCSTIIERADSFLLVQEGPKGPFNLPGGGPKGAETLWDAAERETREETGLLIAVSGLVGVYQCRKTTTGNNVTRFVFTGEEKDGVLAVSEQHPVVAYFCWQAINDLKGFDMLANGTVLTAIADYRNDNCAGLEAITLMPNAGKNTAPMVHPAAVS